MIANRQRLYRVPFLFIAILAYSYATAANRVIATIPVGDSPAGIAITPDGRFAYVANNNNDDLPNGNTVSVIDLQYNAVIATISDPSFNQPYTVTINKQGTIAYVTNSYSTTITIIDIATNNVVGTINGFNGPSGMVITPDGTRAYVNNYGAGGSSGTGTTVNVVDVGTNTIIDTITVGLAPASLAITPDGAFVYVINYVDGNIGTGTVSIIQTRSNTVVGTIGGFSGPFSIVITSNGDYAYITNFGSNNFSPVGTTVSVLDLQTNTVSTMIKVGIQPSGIALAPHGAFAYVTNYNTLYLGPNFSDLTPGQGTVNIIDLATNQVVCPVIVVGESPANIAVSPDGTRAYVSNYSSNTVSVIDIQDRMWLALC